MRLDFCRDVGSNCTMSTLKYLDQRLHFGLKNHDLCSFAKDYHSPIYCYEWSGIETRYKKLSEAFGPAVRIHYAMKANSHEDILSRLAKLGAGVDTVSGGEIDRAIDCGFKPEKIIFSGVGKTIEELSRALSLKIHQVNVESLPELERLIQLCRDRKSRMAIGLRLNPDVDAKTHPYITTGSKMNKFGIDGETAIQCLNLIKKNSDAVKLQGLTVHVGSQILDVSVFESALHWLMGFTKACESDGHVIESLDLGGGIGIFYDKEDLESEERLMQAYAATVLRIVDPKKYRILLEPGRWLVAHSGILIGRIEYVKKTPQRNFVILDTGVHHLIRPALYNAVHRILTLQQGPDGQNVDVVGPLCESSDVLARDISLPIVKEGDLVAIADSGAYGFEMANEYNLRDRPARVLLE